MKEKRKRKGVSRRDFLKGLGGGAVGTAVLATGILKPDRIEGASPGKLMTVTRKVAAKSQEVKGLQGVLASEVLKDIQKVIGQEEVLVNCRLNQTNNDGAAPIWYGWVESQALQQKSGGQPARDCIGLANLSPIYAKCLAYPRVDYVHEIDYSKPAILEVEKTRSAFRWDVRLGLFHRRYVAIVVNCHRVGTLTVGFPKPPTDDNQLKQRLLYWAQNPGSPLVRYLTSTFKLGGPEI